ncbi:hypothetical protein Hte_002457 [Hypoxylon texense]
MSVTKEQVIEMESLAPKRTAKKRTEDRDSYPRGYLTRGNEPMAVAGPGEKLGPYQKEQIGSEFQYFMSLPPEIRIMVYKCCLLKGTIFVPRNAFTSPVKYKVKYTMAGGRHPSARYKGVPTDWGALYEKKKHIGLICGVSRQVQAEALPIFYGGNRFVFPYGYWVIPNILMIEPPPKQQQQQQQQQHQPPVPTSYEDCPKIGDCIRDLSIAFDARDHDAYGRARLAGEGVVAAAATSKSSGFEAWREQHELQRSLVLHAWRRHLWHCQAMRLDRLRLCFGACYCPLLGCCRLVGAALDELARCGAAPRGRWRHGPPRVVEVVGWKDEGERAAIEEALRRTFRGGGGDNGDGDGDDAAAEIRFIEPDGEALG